MNENPKKIEDDIVFTHEAVSTRIRGKINNKYTRYFFEEYLNKRLNLFSKEVIDALPEYLREPILYTQSGYVFKAIPLEIYNIGKSWGIKPNDAKIISGSVDFLFILSFILDDIKDMDKERDGQPAAWVRYGKTITMKSFQMGYQGALKNLRSHFGIRIANIYFEDISHAIESLDEQRQLTFDRPLEDIFSDWDKRALHLYHSPLYSYAMLTSVEENKLQEAVKAMRLVMRMGQLYNDLRDIGSKRFSDLKNGYVTAPLKIIYDNVSNESKGKLLHLMGKRQLESGEIEQIKSLIKESKLYSKVYGFFNEFLVSAEKSYLLSASETEGRKYFNKHIAYIKSKLNLLK